MFTFSHLTQIAAACALLWLACYLFWAVYALILHPLSRYPGSWLAAVDTAWYEWYWNYFQKGQMLFEIERLHKVHGPVVRIGCNDIHVNDPAVYLDITKVSSTFTKDPFLYQAISFPGTSIGGTDPVAHRIRRKVLTPALSGRRVLELAPLIEAKVDQLMGRLAEASSAGAAAEPVCMTAASKAFTMDIISRIVLGREVGCVADPAFRNDFITHLQEACDIGWTATAFPKLSAVALFLANRFSITLFPLPLLSFRQRCLAITKDYLKKYDPAHAEVDKVLVNNVPDQGQPIEMGEKSSRDHRSAVIDMLMTPSSAEGHRLPTLEELNDEILVLLTAGNDTTSNSMIVGIYQICRNPVVYQTLVSELEAAIPSLIEGVSITYEEAKKLPYLTATIKETLRFANPLPGRLPRVVPADGYNLYGHNLPPGVKIHLSPYLLNRHPDVWSRPQEFDPSRWLAEDASHLEKYMASFNRGARQCLGKDLAWCELWVVFANLFRRFHVKIHQTTDADMEWTDVVLMVFKGELYINAKNRQD